MKKIIVLILITFLLTFTSCNKTNHNVSSINDTNKQQTVENSNQNIKNPINNNETNNSNNKSDEDESKTLDGTTGNEDEQQNHSYMDFTLYKEIENTFEYEIIDISDVEYPMEFSGDTSLVYIAYIKINHYFDQDLVNQTNYELSSDWKNTIEYTYTMNQQYEELCSSDDYKEHKEIYTEEVRELLVKMAIKKEDLNYFSIHEKYIGYLNRYRKVAFLDAEGTNQYIQVIDMTDIGYSLKIKDNQLVLEGLTPEQLEKMNNENSFLNMNKYLPEKCQLKINGSVNDYINWLVDVYHFREEIRQEFCK